MTPMSLNFSVFVCAGFLQKGWVRTEFCPLFYIFLLSGLAGLTQIWIIFLRLIFPHSSTLQTLFSNFSPRTLLADAEPHDVRVLLFITVGCLCCRRFGSRQQASFFRTQLLTKTTMRGWGQPALICVLFALGSGSPTSVDSDVLRSSRGSGTQWSAILAYLKTFFFCMY